MELLDFRPDVILIDAWPKTEMLPEDISILESLAAEQQCRVWLGVESTSLNFNHSNTLYLQTRGDQLTLQQGQNEVSLTNTRLLKKGSDRVLVVAKDCTLFSGGATGSESYFGQTAHHFGLREVHFTFDGHHQERTIGSTMLSEHELNIGSTSLAYVSKVLNRTWSRTENLQRVLQIQWHLVSHADQLFVVGTIQPDGTVHGGTGWSVELAKRWHKDLWVFDQVAGSWFHWNGSSWEINSPLITRRNIAATGTRFLNTAGKKAINELFSISFPN
jgi:hypothetical protein